MIRPIALFCTASLCFLSPLLSDEPDKWSVDALYNHIPTARFHRPNSQRHHHLNFSETYLLGTYTHRHSDTTGFKYGVGFQGNTFHFSHHPLFSQRHFSNLLLRVGAYTKDIERWKWNLDLFSKTNTQHFHLSRYTYFTGQLKGKYAWHEKRNLYAGVIAFMGMHYSRALPIIGFDYTPSPRWKFNVVFPLNINVEYGLNAHWFLEGALRYFFTHDRMGKDDKLKRGLVTYRNWGLEGAINYRLNKDIILNAHVGESLAGRMRVSNQHDHHRKHLLLGCAPYFGFAAELTF